MSFQDTHFICEIQLLKATNVPVSDLSKLSCDPFIRAEVETFSSDDTIAFRTPTIRNTLNPVYNLNWVISGIPSSGFLLTLTLLDQDVVGSDKKLGKATVRIPDRSKGQTAVFKDLDTGVLECKVEKRRGGLRTHIATYVAFITTRGRVSHHVRIWIRIRVLDFDRSDYKRLATLGPPWYTRHFSPLIGHFISGYNVAKDKGMRGKDGRLLSPTTFIANRLQLSGPPPPSLHFRYTAYNTFIGRLFTKRGFRGKFFHYALHRQYKSLYGYAKTTVYGIAGDGEFGTDDVSHPNDRISELEKGSPNSHHDYLVSESTGRGCDLARQFLEMACYGKAGRLFTYVITLDSELRFTETGEEFSIDFLSKHSMHADAAKEITFSGEFFVRRLSENTNAGYEDDLNESIQSTDPKDYELVIDNSSGTYRPKGDLLPNLKEWLSEDDNLGALGKITAIDGFDENLKRWKKERQELKTHIKSRSKRHMHQRDNACE